MLNIVYVYISNILVIVLTSSGRPSLRNSLPGCLGNFETPNPAAQKGSITNFLLDLGVTHTHTIYSNWSFKICQIALEKIEVHQPKQFLPLTHINDSYSGKRELMSGYILNRHIVIHACLLEFRVSSITSGHRNRWYQKPVPQNDSFHSFDTCYWLH